MSEHNDRTAQFRIQLTYKFQLSSTLVTALSDTTELIPCIACICKMYSNHNAYAISKTTL